MIHLQSIAPPEELTEEKIKELTEQFLRSKNPVWAQDYIKRALLELSFGKCCYCETIVIRAGSFMEVEHFYPKSIYPSEVMDWSNLLPSCKRCNSKKSKYDTKKNPIIHPVRDFPQQHLKIYCYQLRHKTELGKRTIQVLDLNDPERLVKERFETGNQLLETLDKLHGRLCNNDSSEANQLEEINALKRLLSHGTPQKPYSATIATIILQDEKYFEIKQWLIKEDLWDDELVNLENGLLEVMLL